MRSSTDEVEYPILFSSRALYFLKFKNCPDELVWEKRSLQRFNGFKGDIVVDNSLRKYEILGSESVRGTGKFAGYFLTGPFLERNVVFRLYLSSSEQWDLTRTAEILAAFIKDSEEARDDDVSHFWKAFHAFLPSAPQRLAALRDFYANFKWGDDPGYKPSDK